MKIVFVCPTSHIKPYHGNSDFEQSMGAAWTVIINMARTFRGLGHDVIVLNNCPAPGVYDGVKYLCRKIPDDIRAIKEDLEGTDVLVVNRGGSLDWHDCLEKFAGIGGYKKVLRTGDRGGAERGQPEKFAQFDKVVSTSEWLSSINTEANNSLSPSLFVGIPAGVDTEGFKPSDDVNRHDIVFCGAVVRPRRPHLLYPIFDFIKQKRPDLPFRLHILGSAAVWGGPPGGNKEPTSLAFRKMLNEHYEEYAQKYGDDIIHYGDLPNREIAEILPHMGMHIYPTAIETCGVSIIESQACGVPVIVPQDSKKTAVKERISHNNTGVYKYFDKLQEVADAAIDLATNDRLYNKIRDKAREKAVNENDWKYICKRWEKEVFMDSPIEIETGETIGVGILSFQNRPMLQKCIESLVTNADMPIKVVVWDNASRKYGSDNVDWLKENYPEIEVIESMDNIGCTASRNNVVKYFRGNHPDMRFMLFTDMDVEFERDFLSPMYKKMLQHEDAGIVAYEEANCGFTPDENGRVSEVMSICNLHRLESFDIFAEDTVPKSVVQETGAPQPRPQAPFFEAFFVYSFDSWMCQILNTYGWHTYILRGRRGYVHHGGQIEEFLPEADEVKANDVKIWQKIHGLMAPARDWRTKEAGDFVINGNELRENGDLEAALIEYLEGISRFPDDDTLYFCLGNLYKQISAHEKARSAYMMSLKFNSRRFEAKYEMDDLP